MGKLAELNAQLRHYPDASSISYEDESPDGPSPPLSAFPTLESIDVDVAVAAANAVKETLDGLQARAGV